MRVAEGGQDPATCPGPPLNPFFGVTPFRLKNLKLFLNLYPVPITGVPASNRCRIAGGGCTGHLRRGRAWAHIPSFARAQPSSSSSDGSIEMFDDGSFWAFQLDLKPQNRI